MLPLRCSCSGLVGVKSKTCFIDTEAMLGKKTVKVNGEDVTIKQNSGGFDLWNSISHGGVKYFASDQNGAGKFTSPEG